jgi:hypothetical protein
MAVPATTSRARKPNIEASSCSGKTKASSISATCRPSLDWSQSSWSALTNKVPAAKPRKPSGRGLPIGRSTILAARSTSGETGEHRRPLRSASTR